MKAAIFLLVSVGISLGASRAGAQVQRVTILEGPPTGVFGIFATGISSYLSKSVPNLEVSHAAGEGAETHWRSVGLEIPQIINGRNPHSSGSAPKG